jgi:hypothetical protein
VQWPTIFGLPAHPLIVHATVVMVPLAALAVALHTFWARARVRLGLVTLALTLVAVVLVPLSTSTGEQLQSEVGNSALVHEHAELADGLLPWVLGLLVVAALLVVRDWRADPTHVSRRRAPWLHRDDGVGRVAAFGTRSVVLGVLAAVMVLGTTVQVVLIGHSGAKAAWHGVASATRR